MKEHPYLCDCWECKKARLLKNFMQNGYLTYDEYLRMSEDTLLQPPTIDTETYWDHDRQQWMRRPIIRRKTHDTITGKFKTEYGISLDAIQYQYKAFDKWESYLTVTVEWVRQYRNYDVLKAELIQSLNEKRFYKVERVDQEAQA